MDLKSDEGLKIACETVLQAYRQLPWYTRWLTTLQTYLAHVQEVPEATFRSEAFQRQLWESEVLSKTGMGTVDVSEAIASQHVADCLWQLRQKLSASDPHLYAAVLREGWRELNRLVAPPMVKRNPRLKKHRLFATLCPAEMSTLVHYPKLRALAAAMGVKAAEQDVSLHQVVRGRLAQVLGDEEVNSLTMVTLERLTLPWLLYTRYVQAQDSEATEVADLETGQERLNPLPAERRRRGMLAIGGGIATIRAIIEFAKEGCKREDLIEHMRSINPEHALSTIRTTLNALIAEWDVLRPNGDDIYLTPRGEGLLETGEADEVSDWLLTRVLGVDHMLHALQQQPLTPGAMNDVLRRINPGWTSDRALTTLTYWLRALQLAETRPDKRLHLTALGESWAAQIHWQPELLAAPEKSPVDSIEAEALASSPFERPSLQQMLSSFPIGIAFSLELVARLDAGLWSHPRRHFAVLTGLSGAGKTVLARGYALALHAGDAQAEQYLATVPVQPGWHDPSCLLGYINPLDSDSYVRTAFIDFLLRASEDLERPYIVVLDEMNLSHPEQYLAPLLSAMETGSSIELHGQQGLVNGVPPALNYPANLVIIGTVNMDETTHGLSDKVLDRATVIEFWEIDVDAYPGWKTAQLPADQLAQLQATLKALMAALSPARLHFGWRTLSDVLGYLEQASRGGVIGFTDALDQAIYAKVLPKLRGEDTPRVQTAFAQAGEALKAAQLRACSAKLAAMRDDLDTQGSARFWR